MGASENLARAVTPTESGALRRHAFRLCVVHRHAIARDAAENIFKIRFGERHMPCELPLHVVHRHGIACYVAENTPCELHF